MTKRAKMILSHAEAMKRLSVGRRRQIGLALDSTGIRLWEGPSGTAVIGKSVNDKARVVIHPDDTATLHFRTTGDGLPAMFGNRPHEFVGVYEYRFGKGQYKALSRKQVDNLGTYEYKHKPFLSYDPVTKQSQYGPEVTKHMEYYPGAAYQRHPELAWELFDGVRFSLKTGECLNPRTTKRERVPEVDREWRRKVTNINRAWKVRVKIRGEAMWDEMAALPYYDQRTYGSLTAEVLTAVIESCDLQSIVDALTLKAIRDYGWVVQQGRMAKLDAMIGSFEKAYARHRDTIRQGLGAYKVVVEQVGRAA